MFAHTHIISHFCHDFISSLTQIHRDPLHFFHHFLPLVPWCRICPVCTLYIPILNQNLRYSLVFSSIVLHHYRRIYIISTTPFKQYAQKRLTMVFLFYWNTSGAKGPLSARKPVMWRTVPLRGVLLKTPVVLPAKKKDPGRCPNLCELFNPYNFHSHSISSQSLMTWALDIFGYPLFFQSNTAVRVHRPLGPRPSKLRACRARFWLCSTPKASRCSALATANTAPSPPALIWWRERRERRERREWPENSWSFLEHLTTSGFSVRNWWESVFQPM